jgi:hypothetical protein
VLIASWHDHEDVHVTAVVGPAVCVRTEENDPFRIELLCNLAREASNGRHRHFSPAKETISRYDG